jgi:MFS family permease
MTSSAHWRPLLPVFAACAAIGLQAGIGMPLVPLALEQQGFDKLTIGIVSAAWPVGMLAFGTRIPQLASRFGAVPAIIGAVLAGALLSVAYTVTSGPVAWAILSFLHGIVGGVPWVVSEIWMNVVAEEKHRGRVAERGRHGELLAKNGLYADMWHRQQEAAAAAEIKVEVSEPSSFRAEGHLRVAE